MLFSNTLPVRSCLIAAFALASASAAFGAAKAPAFGWGKAGVSYEQYRADALACAQLGFASDVDDTAPVVALRDASQRMESMEKSLPGAAQSAAASASGGAVDTSRMVAIAQDIEFVRSSARPAHQIKELKEVIFETIRGCMTAYGYVRFRLLGSQRDAYAKASDDKADEARKYLYSLASDPAVLESQLAPLDE